MREGRLSEDQQIIWEEFKTRAQERADDNDISFRKALTWTEPYDFEHQSNFIRDLPEYDVVDLQIGGIIAVEDKYG